MSHPVSNTGLPMYMPSLFPEGVYIYIAGCADDAKAGRGQGTSFLMSSGSLTTPQTLTQTFSFLDWVYFAGGGINWAGALPGDWASLSLQAPATTVAPNSNKTGACDIMGNYVMPNFYGTGAYDLTYAVPIPAYDSDGNPLGYWNWSEPDTGLGTMIPAPPQADGTPTGSYVLIPAAIPLAQFISKYQLNGNGMWNLNMPFIKPQKVLPQWQVQVQLRNSGHANLTLSWQLICARMQTI